VERQCLSHFPHLRQGMGTSRRLSPTENLKTDGPGLRVSILIWLARFVFCQIRKATYSGSGLRKDGKIIQFRLARSRVDTVCSTKWWPQRHHAASCRLSIPNLLYVIVLILLILIALGCDYRVVASFRHPPFLHRIRVEGDEPIC
jgi:hypothetical protein